MFFDKYENNNDITRDEEVIIKENIEYHLSQGVDYFIATDNKSIDSTTQILKTYESMGVLRYLYEGEVDYSQHKWVTRMARMARMAYEEYGADWVINNDADEFWWPAQGSLSDTFKKIPERYNILRAPRSNFVWLFDVPSGIHPETYARVSLISGMENRDGRQRDSALGFGHTVTLAAGGSATGYRQDAP